MTVHIRRRHDERGSVSVWLALAALTMVLCVGIAVDLGGHVHAQQRAVAFAVPPTIPGPVGLREPDMRRQHRKADVLPDMAFRVEYRRAKPVEPETAAAP